MDTIEYRNYIIQTALTKTAEFREAIEKVHAEWKKERLPLKTQKAIKLQQLVDTGAFGCNSEAVAKALAILCGEPIAAKQEAPRVDVEMFIPGVCFRLKEDGKMKPTVWCVSTAKDPDDLINLATGKLKKVRWRHITVDAISYVEEDDIRKLVANIPDYELPVIAMMLARE